MLHENEAAITQTLVELYHAFFKLKSTLYIGVRGENTTVNRCVNRYNFNAKHAIQVIFQNKIYILMHIYIRCYMFVYIKIKTEEQKMPIYMLL